MIKTEAAMDKRKEANLRVKHSITEALLGLMREKSFSDISITEIIQTAKVARASFYRNYDSKEDVLATLIEDILEKFREEISGEGTEYYNYPNVLRSFQYFEKYSRYVLDLYFFGYGSLLLEKLNQFHEIIAGTMRNHSVEKYKLYMYIGALFNTAVIWLRNGTVENVEDIAMQFCQSCGIRIP